MRAGEKCFSLNPPVRLRVDFWSSRAAPEFVKAGQTIGDVIDCMLAVGAKVDHDSWWHSRLICYVHQGWSLGWAIS